jgi:hypothetical protein
MSLTGLTKTLFGGRAHAYLSDDIDDVLFNVVTDESVTDANDVTQHAIEDGSDVEDHVISKPRTFAVNIVLSDNTIDLLDPMSVINKFTATIKDRIEILDNWLALKKVLTYYAIDEDIEDVVIQSLTRRRSLDLGTGAGFNLVLSQVNIADSDEVNVKVKTAKPANPKSKTKAGEVNQSKWKQTGSLIPAGK